MAHPILSERTIVALAARVTQRFPQSSQLLIANSAGIDSTALTLIAARLAAQGQIPRPATLHVDHGQHREHDRAAAAAAALAAALGLKHHTIALQIAPGASENALREARYAAFERTARAARADGIATGHHADDQLETVLFRIRRGSGWRGWAGIPAERRLGDSLTLHRPLLDVRRAELEAAADPAREFVVEDPTNADLGPARNRIRHALFPRLRAAIPDLDRRLATIAAESRALARAIDSQLGAASLAAPPEDTPRWRLTLREQLRRAHLELTGEAPLTRWLARAVDLAFGPDGRELDAHPSVRARKRRGRVELETAANPRRSGIPPGGRPY